MGAVLAFGAGALISSVAFELAQEGLRIGSPLSVAAGIAIGALTFFAADRAVDKIGGRGGGGLPLAVGALLDGIPEQAVLGIGIAAGKGVSVALLVMLVDSMIPEATRKAGNKAGLSTVLGFAVAADCPTSLEVTRTPPEVTPAAG